MSIKLNKVKPFCDTWGDTSWHDPLPGDARFRFKAKCRVRFIHDGYRALVLLVLSAINFPQNSGSAVNGQSGNAKCGKLNKPGPDRECRLLNHQCLARDRFLWIYTIYVNIIAITSTSTHYCSIIITKSLQLLRFYLNYCRLRPYFSC